MVDVRPNKADSSGPALVGGLVYRVKEECITVAVEEAPEEGLDQPLRLEKLANEVLACCAVHLLHCLDRTRPCFDVHLAALS